MRLMITLLFSSIIWYGLEVRYSLLVFDILFKTSVILSLLLFFGKPIYAMLGNIYQRVKRYRRYRILKKMRKMRTLNGGME
jgi:ABC-type multidrug transport system fused ATPase/permease subunit